LVLVATARGGIDGIGKGTTTYTVDLHRGNDLSFRLFDDGGEIIMHAKRDQWSIARAAFVGESAAQNYIASLMFIAWSVYQSQMLIPND